MLTVDTVCDQNMLTGSSPGAATVMHQTGTVFVCYFTVIGQFLGIFYSYGFKAILGIRYQRFYNLILRYTVEPRYNERLQLRMNFVTSGSSSKIYENEPR